MTNLCHRPVTPKHQPKKLRRLRHADRPYLDWLKTLPCAYCNHLPPSDPAHVILGGRGGMGVKPLFSAVPLCRNCHTRSHSKDYLAMLSKDSWLGLADQYLERWRRLVGEK